MDYAEHLITAAEGTALYARDYAANRSGPVPIVCLPGLTRKAKDFETIAPWLAESRRVLAVPTSAVRVDQAQPYVLAVVGDHIELRKVTLGVRGELRIDGRVESAVEVTGGVDEGAVLLRGAAGAVRDGTKVRVAAQAAAAATPGASAAR